MEKWLDLLTPSAAALSLLLAIALVVQAVRHGRAVRRLESRLAEREGAAARVSLDRLTQLQQRARTSTAPVPAPRSESVGRSMPGLATAGVVVAVLAVVAGTGWYLFVRDGDSGSATERGTSTATAPTPTATQPQPIDGPEQVPENPTPLPQSKGAYTILVLNASGVTGAARSVVVPKVQGFGWNTAPPDNASTSNEKTSFVMYLPGKEDVADNIGKDLGITRKEPQDGYEITQDTADVDAIVVVGRDLTTRLSP